jgi:predicted Zn finger-like uncharacterized protein
MILECPNCNINYEIPVELPLEGRKVRCVSCQHVWNATPADQPKPAIPFADFEDPEIVFKNDEDTGEESAPESPAESAADEDIFADAGSVPADDSFSESALEEAFSAAAQETDTTDAEFESEEAESPPIVIKKAKKRRRFVPGGIAAGWTALAIVLAGVTSFSYFQRVTVVRVLPGTAATYARLGLPVIVRGLEFDKIKYSWESNTGRPVLEVYGDIINVTSEPLKVPTVVFGLRTKEKVEVYQWAADVRSELLPAGQRTAFSAQIPTPPKSIRDVQVRFAKVR